jgi:hypothetical protein
MKTLQSHKIAFGELADPAHIQLIFYVRDPHSTINGIGLVPLNDSIRPINTLPDHWFWAL